MPGRMSYTALDLLRELVFAKASFRLPDMPTCSW